MPTLMNACFPPRVGGLLALLTSVLLPVAAIAQDSRLPAAPPEGTTVLLELGSGYRIKGALVGRVGTDIVLVTGDADSTRVPATGVIHARRFEGRGSRGWGTVGTGAAIGAGLGLVLIGVVASDHTSSEYGVGVVLSTVAAGALTLAGTAIGGAVALIPEDHWSAFDPATIGTPVSMGVR